MNAARRRLLLAAGGAGVAAWGGAGWWLERRRAARPAPAIDARFPHPLRLPGSSGLHALYDAPERFALVSQPLSHDIVPGRRLSLLAYVVEHGGEALLNPLIRVRRGARLRVRYWNALDEPSIVHWHGLRVDTNNDGHPHYAVDAGATYDYQFTVANRGGTYWYHPHPHHLAARQAHRGLSGLLIVEDDDERALAAALGTRLGVTDIPLMLQDPRYGAHGEPDYAPAGHGAVHGHLGDSVLVNLTPAPRLDVATGLYRFRLVNASNARIYRIAFLHDGAPLAFDVIAGDGGLLREPRPARELYLAPGERADLVLDLTGAEPGDRIVAATLPVTLLDASDAAAFAGPVPAACEPLDLLLLRVVRREPPRGALPASLSLDEPPRPDASWPVRRFMLDFHAGLWRIDGATYRIDRTAFTVRRNRPEIWEFRSRGAAMPHPIHVHGYQFRVMDRGNASPQALAAADGGDGLGPTERGWKDTALLWPGETLRLALDFAHDHPGDQVYVLQCHNLEHESHGMMVNFRVAA